MEPGAWGDVEQAKEAETQRLLKIVERAFEGEGGEQCVTHCIKARED